ncbi:hypothetical protein PHLGIDRAFT_164907 [Phlebiopsis gigantea 11061_1 CR5-6]|uniref:Uncharacterized protein n=1 Tax=Phlebiopsis gigantea (strain 11061_1 CR5-6) TaxID=745531 RepID=A0A0C3PH34_PHLG1|nr:hypothetical protein PHLGIDRAFT_164907 [Phlebiopsis gigantea 11061_1 CR5-6]
MRLPEFAPMPDCYVSSPRPLTTWTITWCPDLQYRSRMLAGKYSEDLSRWTRPFVVPQRVLTGHLLQKALCDKTSAKQVYLRVYTPDSLLFPVVIKRRRPPKMSATVVLIRDTKETSRIHAPNAGTGEHQ